MSKDRVWEMRKRKGKKEKPRPGVRRARACASQPHAREWVAQVVAVYCSRLFLAVPAPLILAPTLPYFTSFSILNLVLLILFAFTFLVWLEIMQHWAQTLTTTTKHHQMMLHVWSNESKSHFKTILQKQTQKQVKKREDKKREMQNEKRKERGPSCLPRSADLRSLAWPYHYKKTVGFQRKFSVGK